VPAAARRKRDGQGWEKITAWMMEEILQRRFVFMVFGSREFRFHLFSPELPRKVSGFLSEASQSFAVLLDLEGDSDRGHDLFEARVAAQIIPLWTKLRAFTGKRRWS
jgi:hypothetical protein